MKRARGVSAGALGYGVLDTDLLTAHLVSLARRVGVEQITMRGLATEIGTSPSSIYYHLKDKDAALDLLIEAVVGDIVIPTDGPWDLKLTELYTNAWHTLVEIPGIAGLLQRRPHRPAADAMDRSARATLAESGIHPDTLHAVHAVLFINLLGAVELQHALDAGASDAGSIDTATVFALGLRLLIAGLRADVDAADEHTL